MKIGLVTDIFAHLSLEELLATAAKLELDTLEFGCGNFSSAPHVNLERLLESELARQEFKAKLADHGLEISALNCSGNPLHPGPMGKLHAEGTRKTIKLAQLLEVERVVMMSGCPGAPGDSHPNWITAAMPPEFYEILTWQWNEVMIPYWSDLVAYANNLGINKLCLEMHGGQNVYNPQTLLRLREAVGETVGANLDPSHLFWMGAEPLHAVPALAGAIYNVHAKDTRVDPVQAGINGLIDMQCEAPPLEHSWRYCTVGYGHGDSWWRSFTQLLNAAGYDHVLSIEHEDTLMTPSEGVEKAVDFLKRNTVREPVGG